MVKKTRVIAGFPATGKTFFYKNQNRLVVLDSDSSKFDKSEFPNNYIRHIKDNLGKVDIIFVSTHDVVRDALLDACIDFYVVYPKKNLKEEYMERYRKRWSSDDFLNLMDTSWDEFIDSVKSQKGALLIRLDSGEYMSDIVQELFWTETHNSE